MSTTKNLKASTVKTHWISRYTWGHCL